MTANTTASIGYRKGERVEVETENEENTGNRCFCIYYKDSESIQDERVGSYKR
jgi:hypothetical protein